MKKILIFAIALISLMQIQLKAETVTVYPTVDTYVTSSTPNSNFGTSTTLRASYTTSTAVTEYAYLKVDFSLPQNAVITSAVLYLAGQYFSNAANAYYFYRVTSSWGESILTYNSQPTITASGGIVKSFSTVGSYNSIDITSFVKLWYAGTANYGMRINSYLSDATTILISSDASSLKPYVVITYQGYATPTVSSTYYQYESTNKNHIVAITPRIGETSISSINSGRYSEDVQYFDGLGRPVETIAIAASPSGKDIVSQIGYDGAGRQAYNYLPFAKASNNGAYVSGTSALLNSYILTNSNEVTSETSPNVLRAETVFEQSPLNRVESTIAPGAAWGNKPVSYDYVTNGGTEVLRWRINSSGNPYCINSTNTAPGYYAAGTLYVTQTTDEDGKVVKEYKDFLGNVVMKKASTLCTYYVYDDFNLLRVVIPPKALDNKISYSTYGYTFSSAIISELLYKYTYDAKHRMITKKLPGATYAVSMVYDARDRLVMTQDANQIDTQWAFIMYDALNRPVMTGVVSDTRTRSDMQNLFNNYSGFQAIDQASDVLYTITYPVSITTADINTVTFYDSYPTASTYTALSYPSVTGYDASYSTQLTGKVTVTKVRPLNANTSFGLTKAFTTTKMFYDKYGRVIATNTLDYNGLATLINNKYDFVGNLLKTNKQIKNGSTAVVSVAQRMVYDHRNRLLETYHSINSATELLLAQNKYNDIGQLIEKKTGLPNTNKLYLQYADYNYNLRGWLTGINNSTLSDGEGDLFGMDICYDKTNITNLGNPSFYNGNISGVAWKISGMERKGYSFTYDGLNRLLTATYKQGSTLATANGFNENMAYDANGNISTLARYQAGTLIDNLTYRYLNDGNKLKNVVDASSNDAGFRDKTILSSETYPQEFFCDNNGNLTKDLNKQIEVIYNYLNLPCKITTSVNTTDKVEYLYDAMGNKLAKKPNVDAASCEYYMGDVVLKGSTFGVEYILTPEGKANYGTGGYTYEYHLKDHLGNTRVAYIAGADWAAVVKQQADYYPFGLRINYPTETFLGGDNDYLYNGKELQDNTLGGTDLDWYDYGARMYDAALGRFMTQDWFAEKYWNLSPYQYAANNPICNIDVNGDSIQYFGSWEEILQFAQTFAALNVGNISLTLTKDEDGNVNGFKSGEFTANEFGGELGKHFETVINSDKMVDIVKVTNTPGKIDDVERYGGMKFNVNDKGDMSIQMTDQWFTGKWRGSGMAQPSYNYIKTYDSFWEDDDVFSRSISFAEGFAHEMVHASRYISGKGTRGYSEENAARRAVNAWRGPRGIEKRGILKTATWGEWMNNNYNWEYEKLYEY